MFRDFHLIQGQKADYLFFPESVKFYTIPQGHGAAITDYLAGGGDVPAALAPLLEKEEAAAREAAERQGSRPARASAADSLCLYMAHDCNLACTYCYNERGRSANAFMMMDDAVIEAALRRYFTEPGHTYAVGFYGGEPLLNFRGMKRAVEIGRALEQERGVKIVYSVTTNGTVASDEIVSFIDRHIDTVTVSLDGPMEVNDRHRVQPGKSGSRGSYGKVLRNLMRFRQETRAKITIKATLAGDAVPEYEQSLRHLRALGVDGVLMTPVNTAPGNPAAIDDDAYADYVRRYTEQSKRFFGADEDGAGADGGGALDIVANLLTKRKFYKHCGAGTNPAITADGSLYACHGLVGVGDFRIGKLGDEARGQEGRIKSLFDRLNVCEVQECRQCWARYLCGGSCYAHAYFNTGSIDRADPRHCMLVKKNAETVIVSLMEAMLDPEKRARVYQIIRDTIKPDKNAAHE